jgi:hypothetical protein
LKLFYNQRPFCMFLKMRKLSPCNFQFLLHSSLVKSDKQAMTWMSTLHTNRKWNGIYFVTSLSLDLSAPPKEQLDFFQL